MTTLAVNKKTPNKRIASFLFKAKGEQLAPFPDDKWILDELKKTYKTDETFRKGANNIFRAAAFTAFNVGAIAGGIILAAVNAPLIGAGIAALSAGHAVYSVTRLKKAVKTFNKDIFPAFQKKIANAFAKKKGKDLKSEFQERYEKNLAQKRIERELEAANKAEKSAAPVKPSDQKPMETAGDMAKAAFNFVRKRAVKEAQKRLSKSDKKPKAPKK